MKIKTPLINRNAKRVESPATERTRSVITNIPKMENMAPIESRLKLKPVSKSLL